MSALTIVIDWNRLKNTFLIRFFRLDLLNPAYIATENPLKFFKFPFFCMGMHARRVVKKKYFHYLLKMQVDPTKYFFSLNIRATASN